MDLPFRAEYAKSGRASCRGCKSTIGQGTLRLAVMVQSPMFDGKTPHWYHYSCFFSKQRPKTCDDIEHFETLRYEDQEKIKEKISTVSVIVPDKKGKKRPGESKEKKLALKDFTIEYAKSGRATCRGCEIKIMKDEVRISKKDFETEVGKKYGGQDMWHHLSCFAKLRSELGYFESAEKLPGFQSLKKEDKSQALKEIPAIKQEDVPEVKKIKKEEPDPQEAIYKEQNKLMYKFRDNLKAHLSKKDLIHLLEYNKQEVPSGEDRILDRLSDIMTFGALAPCKLCQGQYVFNKIGYICHGDLTEWTKCNNITKEPDRVPFKVPSDLKEEFPFLKKYKYVERKRLIKDVNPSSAIKKKEDETDGPKIQREKPALYEMQFVILGHSLKNKEQLKETITKFGGKVVTKIQDTVMAIISTEDDVEAMGSRMEEAKAAKIHVVPESFLEKVEKYKGKIPELIEKKSICNWGSNPAKRMPVEKSKSSGKSKSKSIYTSKMPSKVKLKVKGGTAVDPDSGLEDKAHVYIDKENKYTTVLGITDIQKQKNSYYKIQLLQADKGNKFWVFRAWGRIGTTIGGNKLESFHSLHEAKEHFCSLYEEKSGNMWEDRHQFVKVPGRMYPIEVDYDDEEMPKMDIQESESNLKPAVQDLIKMIFDVNNMKKLMLEFELDTEKMPLGRLSKAQIQNAYKVLSELQDLIDKEGSQSMFIDASNRFYTLIPHSFGVEEVPVLNSKEQIKQKNDMLDNLMELEVAYSLMKTSGSEHTVDQYYKQLNTDIDVLDRESNEFKIIEEYVKNTHAATHNNYSLEIEEVYMVKRKGEEKRFKPFKKLHNRQLLWHGSRTTNFAGILSQGLRIAPPEAPVTGYMFGKGIYFADMVSKSANYCCTDAVNPKGLLLLCDVALGEVLEEKEAKYIEKLPKGKHSTKGVGRTAPDPDQYKEIDGVRVPLGPGKPVPKCEDSSLLYNEYIVYDVAQVNIKYLLKLNFKYKF